MCVCVYEFGSATPREVLQSLNECVSFESFRQIRQLDSDLVVWAGWSVPGDEAASSNVI